MEIIFRIIELENVVLVYFKKGYNKDKSLRKCGISSFKAKSIFLQ